MTPAPGPADASRGSESALAALIRHTTAYVALAAAGVLALFLILSLANCVPVERPAVSLSIERSSESPRDAAVTIDEEYIGPLGYVAAHGVRMPAGKHRISIEKPGYFPWDRLIDAGSAPIKVDVALEPIPD